MQDERHRNHFVGEDYSITAVGLSPKQNKCFCPLRPLLVKLYDMIPVRFCVKAKADCATTSVFYDYVI